MRPRDPRYNSIPLAGAANVDATVAYVATRSPVSNTFARFENAERRRNEGMTSRASGSDSGNAEGETDGSSEEGQRGAEPPNE